MDVDDLPDILQKLPLAIKLATLSLFPGNLLKAGRSPGMRGIREIAVRRCIP